MAYTKKAGTPAESLLSLIVVSEDLESVTQTELTAPAAVIVAVVACRIAAGELVVTVLLVVYRIVVNAEAVAMGMPPVLVEQVADIDDIKAQFERIHLTAHLETVLLCEMHIEVMFKGKVVGITLVELATVILHVGVMPDPVLHQLPLHIFRQLGCREAVAEDGSGKCIGREVGLVETHPVNLSIRRDEEQVVSVGTVLVDVTVVIEGIRRTAAVVCHSFFEP